MRQDEAIRKYTVGKMDLFLAMELASDEMFKTIAIAELVRDPVGFMKRFFVDRGVAYIQAASGAARKLGERFGNDIK